ncbi:MAG: metal-dependent transcriptional regulator [Myxococcota bacterium]
MTSASVENYLKAIYRLQGDGDSRVKTKAIADRLDLALPSVTSMLKTLADQNYVHYVPYQGVRLSEPGRLAALGVIRKHRLIELFLMETLEMDWSEVHAEAELLEHAMSEKLTDRIDAFLGYPTLDPHGDPIPTREGVMPELGGRSLHEVDRGERVVIRRVLTQDRAFLTYLNQKGLVLDAQVDVVERAPFEGPITVQVEGQDNSVSLSHATAGLILVITHNPPT